MKETTVGATGGQYRFYYIADTDAGKPVTGLNVGDLCWAVDTGLLYVATSTTTWAKFARTDTVNVFTETSTWQDGIIIEDSAVVFKNVAAGWVSGLDDDINLTATRQWILPDATGALVVVGGGYGFGADPPASGQMGKVNRTAQVAAITSTNLTNTTAAGLYRISYFLRCTTADATAGGITASFTYTDDVGATTDTTAAIVLTATTSRVAGSFTAYLASGNITYLTTLTGIIGTSKYQLRARCEFLG